MSRRTHDVDTFIDATVDEYRSRLALLDDCGDRRALEDAIALLTDYRLQGMDARAFETLLATLCGGRSPVRLAVLKPEAVGLALRERWRAHLRDVTPAAEAPAALAPELVAAR